MKFHVKVQKPHVKPQHVKHVAGLNILAGTIMEAAHMFYPSGLILLCIGGIVAIYEPYFVTEHKEIFLVEPEDEPIEDQI